MEISVCVPGRLVGHVSGNNKTTTTKKIKRKGEERVLFK